MICLPEVIVLLFHPAGTLVSLTVSNGVSSRTTKTICLKLSRHLNNILAF